MFGHRGGVGASRRREDDSGAAESIEGELIDTGRDRLDPPQGAAQEPVVPWVGEQDLESVGGGGHDPVGIGSLDEFDPRDLTDGFGESGTVHWMEHYSVASPAHRAIHYDRWPMGG